jgi:Fur family transcriptional regulator, ferric uptake regulator
MASSALHRQVDQRLRESETRYTKGRRAVVNALADSDGPRSAAELSSQLGESVPVSSLYRTLSILEEAGVVVPHLATKGLARYELSEWLTGHHHHLVCTECGRVEDIDVPPKYEAQVHKLVDAIASGVAFTATNHALEIEGRCARCA